MKWLQTFRVVQSRASWQTSLSTRTKHLSFKQQPLQQSKQVYNNMTVAALPDYCKDCSWLFSKMGACRPPQVSYFFSFVSFLPYVLILLFIGLSLFLRGSRQIKMAILLVTGYIVADRMVKNLLAMPRPPGACKQTYGMPSSHMVALCSYIFAMIPNCRKSQKFFFVFLLVSQGMARVQLKYHYWDQVLAGVLFAFVYTYLFNMGYEKLESTQTVQNMYRFLGVRQDVKEGTPRHKKQ